MTKAENPRRAPILDGRLSTAMALAGRVDSFADIGADHGRLSAAMLLNDHARHALVADISPCSLEKARGLIARLGLNDRVTFAVADGLDALGGSAVDLAFILGMGGDTLSGILRRGRPRLRGAALVLGAHTALPLVRETICQIGYRIRQEAVVHDSGRDYVLMRCTPAQKNEPAYTEVECLLGPVLMRECPPGWLAVLKRRKRLLTQEIEAMRAARLQKDAERLAHSVRELSYVEACLRRYEQPSSE
ncbi:MAG: class I SAM-dependent methyltransferase [Clostridiales bacterium]|nr:class I SAM-dependent methyltransferase [Clostridiales bacterium]